MNLPVDPDRNADELRPSNSQIFKDPAFSFEIPASWQLMSDLWPNDACGRDYYKLGVTEIVLITTSHKPGEFNCGRGCRYTPIDAWDLGKFTVWYPPTNQTHA